MKCSAVKIDGIWRDVFKCPIDAPWKASKGGKVGNNNPIVWRDGAFIKEYTFGELRAKVAELL